ncbi:MAG: TonB-dependent receptor plug domain-containing protein [Gemmatimonadota bacterium]
MIHRSLPLVIAAATLLGLAQAPPAIAQEAEPSDSLDLSERAPVFVMEEIQVTATRTERGVFDVPAPVSVIDEGELERRQAAKPGDIFALQPGLEVEGSGPFLGLPVVRGLSGNRVLLLVDGQRLNNSREAVNFGGVQPSLVAMGEIEEIEILRGPASVLYGTDALGGIVNIRTRRPPVPTGGLVVGGTLRPRYGSSGDQRSGQLDLYLASPSVSLLLQGSLRDAENFESPRGEVVNSGAESRNLSAALELRPWETGRLILDVESYRGEDIGLPGTAGVFTGFFPSTTRDKVSLRYEGVGPGLLPSLKLSVYVQDQEEDFSTLLDLPPIPAGPFSLLIDNETSRVSDVRTVGFDVQADAAIGASHLLTYGLEFFRDDVEETRREVSTRTFVPTIPGPAGMTETEIDDAPTTPDGTFQGAGVYVQDEIRTGRLTLLPGVRYDRFDIETRQLERPEGDVPAEDRTEDAVSASLGALYALGEHLHLTAGVGRAFRTPNLIERYFFGPGSQGGLSVPNPDLDNETSLNVDVGLKIQTPALMASVTYFNNRIDDFITFVPATFLGDSTFGGSLVTTVDNVGDVRIRGLEAAAETRAARWGSVWSAFGAFTLNRGDNLSQDGPLFVPPTKLVLGTTWRDAAGRFSAGATTRLVAEQDRVPDGFSRTAGFGVVDLHGSVDLAPLAGTPLTVRARLVNLTDKVYMEPFGGSLEPGRSLILSLEYAFRANLYR